MSNSATPPRCSAASRARRRAAAARPAGARRRRARLDALAASLLSRSISSFSSRLAPPQPVGDLLQRPSPLGGVLLEVGVRLLDEPLRDACELVALARDQLPLLVELPLQAARRPCRSATRSRPSAAAGGPRGVAARRSGPPAASRCRWPSSPAAAPRPSAPRRAAPPSCSRRVERSRSATSRRRSVAIRRSSSASSDSDSARSRASVSSSSGSRCSISLATISSNCALPLLDLALEQPLARVERGYEDEVATRRQPRPRRRLRRRRRWRRRSRASS